MLFRHKDYSDLKAFGRSRYKKSSLPSPIWLKAGCKFVKVVPSLPCLPFPSLREKL